MKKIVKFPRGTVVQALRHITDVDHHGQPYLHAVKGEYGIVLDDDAYHIFPNVQWGRCGNGGVCNVPAQFLRKISYREVDQVVDFPTEPCPKLDRPPKIKGR